MDDEMIKQTMLKHGVNEKWFEEIKIELAKPNDKPIDFINSELRINNLLIEICLNLRKVEYSEDETIQNTIDHEYLDMLKSMHLGEQMVSNTSAKCPKCGKENAYYSSVQTRSADEASTRIYLCLECNNRWKRS